MGCLPSLHVACGIMFIIGLLIIVIYALNGAILTSSRQVNQFAAGMSAQAENLPLFGRPDHYPDKGHGSKYDGCQRQI